jgi:FKBP-type peptidyl-prolyl cis-trans isomerase
MKNKIKLLCFVGIVALLTWGCDHQAKWRRQEKMEIDVYITSLGDTAYVMQPSGIYYIELQAGTGRSPVLKDTILFKYTGMFLDRVVFDSNESVSTTIIAVIGNYNLVPGLEEGFTLMKEGGRARILTPSNLAYGSTGWFIIPGHTPLIWEVTLVKVMPGSKK